MRRLLLTLLCLSLPAIVSAQTHPCDQPPQTTATKGSKVGWCVVLDDLSAFWQVNIAGEVFNVGVSSPIGGPSASGQYYLEVLLPVSKPRGTYPVSVWGMLDSEAGFPSDVIFWQVGGPPSKPSKPRIVAVLRLLTKGSQWLGSRLAR